MKTTKNVVRKHIILAVLINRRRTASASEVVVALVRVCEAGDASDICCGALVAFAHIRYIRYIRMLIRKRTLFIC